MSSSELLEYVTRTVAVGGRLELLDYAFELGMAVIRSSGFPVDWFERVHEALASPQIAGHQDAWKLLKMLGDNWDAMSQEQKELSRRRALAMFESDVPWLTGLVIAEIFAEREQPNWTAHWILRAAQAETGISAACAIYAVRIVWPRLRDANDRRALMEVVRNGVRSSNDETRREAAVTLQALRNHVE